MSQAQAHAHDGKAQHAHPNYFKVWGILVGLLVVSVTGPMLGIRVVTLIAAFGVALVKAYMVAKNFMHLNVEKPVIHWVLGVALIFMVLLYAGVAPDVQKDKGDHWIKNSGFHYVSPAASGEAGQEHGKGDAHH